MTDPAIGLGQITGADPTFDLTAFLHEAADSMLAVKSAVQNRDPIDVYDLVSGEIYDDLRLEIEGLFDRGAVHNFDGLSVSQASVAAADHSVTGDQITVLFQAGASQSTIGEAQNPDRVGMPPIMPFSEYWTFSRPAGASSQAPSRSECPTCGAPIDIDTGRICRYCKTLLPPPRQQVGWTVVAIRPATSTT